MSIAGYVFDLFGQAFSVVFGWFVQLLYSAGALDLYLAIFVIFCIVRFLVAPLIGDSIASFRHDRRVEMSNQRKAKQKKGD